MNELELLSLRAENILLKDENNTLKRKIKVMSQSVQSLRDDILDAITDMDVPKIDHNMAKFQRTLFNPTTTMGEDK